jgi:hypothetical protein
LTALAAAAAHLVPAKIACDMVDAVQGLDQVAGEHHILHELRDAAVADHVAVGGGEREVFE